MKKIILNIICLSLFAAAGFSQNKKSESRDKYDKMAFAGFSKKADAESEKDDAVKAVKFGNSFELNGNSESAAIWYAKGGIGAFLGAVFLVLGMTFLLQLDAQAQLRPLHQNVEVLQWALLLIGVGIVVYMALKQRKTAFSFLFRNQWQQLAGDF